MISQFDSDDDLGIEHSAPRSNLDDSIEVIESTNGQHSDGEDLQSHSFTKPVVSVSSPPLVCGCRALSVGETDPWDNATIALLMLQSKEEDSPSANDLVPYQVQKNAVFLIDTSKLKHPDDVKSDGNGVWKGQRGELSLHYKYDPDMIEVIKTNPGSGIGFFRTNYTHGTELAYRRVIVRCPQLKLAFLQYYFKDGMEVEFEPGSYRRSYKSTKEQIQRLAGSGIKPREINEAVLDSAGDITDIKSPCQIAKMKQIYYEVSRTKPSKEEDYNTFTLECVDSVGCSNAFVREVATAPSFLALLATDRQLDDLVRFGTSDMFSVDTTFQIGEYYVTVFIVRHKFLVNKETGTTPIVICAAAIHKQKDSLTYRRMTAQILSLRPQFRNARLFGTDSDSALFSAIQEVLPDTKHIICMVHFTENLKRKLKETGMECHLSEVLDLVLGKKVGGTRFQGYVHCETDEQYASTETALKDRFTEMHANGAKFAEYFFAEKAPMLRVHYSMDVQKLAGARADHFSTNACESANAMIKRDKHHYRSLTQFSKDLRDIATSQTRNFELSMINEGKFRIIPQYRFLEVAFRKYSEMSIEKKDALRKRFHTEPYDPERQIPDVIDLATPEHQLLQHKHGVELMKIKCVGTERLLEITEIADRILANKNPVSPVPGGSTTEFFVSGMATRSTFRVTVDSVTFRVHCEGLSQPCKHYEAFGVCAEILAAAMHQNLLEVVVAWSGSDTFINSSKFGLHKLMSANAAANAGRKPRGTAIRRGPTTRAPPAAKLDDVSLPSVLSQPNASGVKRFATAPDDSTPKRPCLITYDRALHRQELWQKVHVEDLGLKPHPHPDEYEIWLLKDCDARTTKCSGCNWQFRKNGKIPDPPNDIVAVAVGKRKFDNKTAIKAGNIYFHVRRKCLEDAVNVLDVVSLSEARLVISSSTKVQLDPLHESRLWGLLH